ncbi:MAG: EAL domain-containing protein [Oscillospiraceae bacterium]|nr:EAL domain-containing protein [Oscillospiraceae bacterium]
MKMTSIRFKITAITVAVILVTFLSVLASSYSAIRRENERRSVEIMRLKGSETKDVLDQYFIEIERSVWMSANLAMDSLDSVALVEYGAAEPAGRTAEQQALLDAYLAEHCKQIQKAFESVAGGSNGVVAYYYCINPEVSETEHGFFYSRIGKAGYIEREPLDASKLDPDDLEHSTWYFSAIERGQPSWIGPYTAQFLEEEWICSYLIPVYKSGVLIGVMGMDIPMETLFEQVKPIRVYDTGFASLCDDEGRNYYYPELEQGLAPEITELTAAGDLLRRGNSGDELIRYTANGEKRQMSMTTLRNGMKLIITAPVREINASWQRLVRRVLTVAALVILAYAMALMFIMGFLTRPLRVLTAAAGKLAEGDYDVDLPYKSRDEVGELTLAFRQMRDRLRSYIEDLSRRVYTDALTGLPNMRSFFRRATDEKQTLADADEQPAMLYFDVIGMKFFNQQYGFEEGDRLLCEIGRILSRQFGERRVCRFSEDHFAAVGAEEGLEERLEAVFREVQEVNGGKTAPLRVGVYPCRLGQVGPAVACDHAKYACDRLKGTYSSGYIWFDNDMLGQLDDTRYIIDHLDQALTEGWIKVYYQPIIRTVNSRVCDEEALSRWIDPKRGFLSPAVFIPILENARLIYKLDLYVLDQILEKMQAQKKAGLQVVPHSLNLSRDDFDVCDVVEEIRRRVDEAGIPRDRLTIEVTESIIGRDFDFMKEQIRRFRALGFKVWMDDFGSGYSSLDVLHEIRFDLIKFDMSFMRRFDEGDESRIILTELVRMAVSLGLDTVCEGVETPAQVEFLREIGCSKLQGYYYCKPIPYESILERYDSGRQIGFENPEESAYYESIGRVNLFDLTSIASRGENEGRQYSNALPVGVMEIRKERVRFVRANKAFRDFMQRAFDFNLEEREFGFPEQVEGSGASFMRMVRRCCDEGSRAFYDGRLPDGSLAHIIINSVSRNPINGAQAVLIAVLSVTEPDKSTTYADIARALAADYYNIYVVDLDSERFIEYSSKAGDEELAIERHGEGFFTAVKRDSVTRIFEADREPFLRSFSKENIVRELEVQGSFLYTYRLIDTGAPLYANMKITRMSGGNRIIMGISIVDAQMKQQEAEEREKQERLAFEWVAALAGGYLAIYSVDPGNNSFFEYSASSEYEAFGIVKQGEDFFEKLRENSPRFVVPEDLPAYSQIATKENMLREIARSGLFAYHYRLLVDGTPCPVSLRAALVKENGVDRLIIGINRTENAS